MNQFRITFSERQTHTQRSICPFECKIHSQCPIHGVCAQARTHNDFLFNNTHQFDRSFLYILKTATSHTHSGNNCIQRHTLTTSECGAIFSQIDEIKMIELYLNTLIHTQTYARMLGVMHTHICLKFVEITSPNDIPLYRMSLHHAIQYISFRFDTTRLDSV